MRRMCDCDTTGSLVAEAGATHHHNWFATQGLASVTAHKLCTSQSDGNPQQHSISLKPQILLSVPVTLNPEP